jgi:hypothetical protein
MILSYCSIRRNVPSALRLNIPNLSDLDNTLLLGSGQASHSAPASSRQENRKILDTKSKRFISSQRVCPLLLVWWMAFALDMADFCQPVLHPGGCRRGSGELRRGEVDERWLERCCGLIRTFEFTAHRLIPSASDTSGNAEENSNFLVWSFTSML